MTRATNCKSGVRSFMPTVGINAPHGTNHWEVINGHVIAFRNNGTQIVSGLTVEYLQARAEEGTVLEYVQ